MAMASPLRTTREKRSSSATSQATGTRAVGIPPCSSSGRGASRVQITKPSGHGSPEATPRVKGFSPSACANTGHRDTPVIRAKPPATCKNLRRSSFIVHILVKQRPRYPPDNAAAVTSELEIDDVVEAVIAPHQIVNAAVGVDARLAECHLWRFGIEQVLHAEVHRVPAEDVASRQVVIGA